jgi:hypothetical protein
MCDFSLMHALSRPAAVGDELVTKNFGMTTVGFADVNELDLAVCVMPGTEIAFEKPIDVVCEDVGRSQYSVVIFRQIDMDVQNTHHDVVEFPDGNTVKLTHLSPGQRAKVLQLPASPRTAEEVQEQTLATVG